MHCYQSIAQVAPFSTCHMVLFRSDSNLFRVSKSLVIYIFSRFTCPEKAVLFSIFFQRFLFFFLLTSAEIRAFSQFKALISAWVRKKNLSKRTAFSGHANWPTVSKFHFRVLLLIRFLSE